MMAAMDKPISLQLADEFFAAVREYVRWGYMGPEPGITNEENELIPISTVCRRVDTFTDPLPEWLSELIFRIDKWSVCRGWAAMRIGRGRRP